MSHQNNSSPSGTTFINNNLGINKKKRKRKFFQVNDNTVNAMNSFKKNTSAGTEDHDGSSKLFQPKKKRKNKKKKLLEEGSSGTVKPILVVKSPLDYSANWKKLKEIMTQDDKKISSGQSARGSKAKAKFDENVKRRKSREKHQKVNGIQNTSKHVEVKEATMEENEKLDIWFDNIDPILLEENARVKDTKPHIMTSDKNPDKALTKEESSEGPTKVIAMDCEMVGVGMDGKDSILARVSIVNQYGKVLYDKFVMPTEEVVDYRTAISGIRPEDIEHGCEFSNVQKEVSDLIQGRILIGHAIHNDLRILYLGHPRSDIRDTAKYKAFKRLFGGRTPSLKKLVERLLGVEIQQGEHNSVQDAQAAMRLYIMHRREWENSRNGYRKGHTVKKNLNPGKKKQHTSQVPASG